MRNVQFILLVTILFSFSCKNKVHFENIYIGQEISRKQLKKNRILIVVNSSQTREGLEINVNGIDYLVAVENDKVVYISTNDLNFKSIEGFYVGMNLCELDSSSVNLSPCDSLSSSYFKSISSGWNIKVNSESKIEYFFKPKK